MVTPLSPDDPGTILGDVGLKDISTYTRSRSDEEVYNIIFTYADMSNISDQDFRALAMSIGGNSNPYLDLESAAIYGPRRLEVQTPWLQVEGGQKGDAQDAAKMSIADTAKEINEHLVAGFSRSAMLESATITIPGDERAQIGKYYMIPDTRMEYYIEGVSHSLDLQVWTTTLQLTRGQRL